MENKSTKTKAEEALLTEKKRKLDQLLAEKNKQNNTTDTKPSDKTALYIGCGIVAIALIFSVFIIVKIRKKKKF